MFCSMLVFFFISDEKKRDERKQKKIGTKETSGKEKELIKWTEWK